VGLSVLLRTPGRKPCYLQRRMLSAISPDDLTMQTISRYLSVTLILFASIFVGACATMSAYKEAPRVSLVSIQPQQMGVLEQRFILQLRILNPNDEAIPVEGLSYGIEINDREFAYGVSRQAVDIPAFGEALLDVEVSSNLLNVVRQLQALNSETRSSLDYRLKGKISLANSPASLPFDYSGELTYLPATAE
jgi:LEA14-like dessication related protein